MAKQKIGKPDQMTVAEAARELKVSVTQVYRLLDDGKLEEYPVQGNITLVTAASVAEAKRVKLRGTLAQARDAKEAKKRAK